MFQCKDLLMIPSMEKAKVIAGKEGLDRGIRWAYKAESMDFSRWIHGQELLIVSTPVIKSPEFDLFLLIKNAAENQMSGVLLLAGEDYVKSIQKEVLQLCKKKRFPVIALPWNVPLVDVFEELGHAIAYHDQMDSGKEDLLSGIIFGNNMDPDVLRMQSEMIGYDINPPQKIFAVHFYKKGENAVSMTKAEKETAVKAIGDTMEKAGFPALISHYSNNVAGIFGSGEEGQKNVLKEAAGHLKEVLDGYHFYFGCGRECASLERLKESFQEASKCIVLGKKLGRDGQVLFWENLGFYHLLMAFDSKEPLDRYSHAVIGGLLQYDRENHSKLLETLEVYLEQNCSLKHTAEILYTHRNTVKYRITRIVEITGKSPDSAFERLELYNAVLIWRFCQ